MTRIRVLVVDDSPTVRNLLCDIVTAAPELELIGSAENGKRAIELALAFRPDVISMDMIMPVMTGVATTEYLMAHLPTPILIVSASTNRGELFRTYDALAAGAVDVLEKPRGDERPGEWEQSYIAALKMVSRIRVITHIRARFKSTEIATIRTTKPIYEVLAIGASTGGPAAIVEVLRTLPDPLPIPLLFLLHINEPFGAAFADWLDSQTHLRVSLARDGQLVAGDGVLMAPPGRHMVVDNRRVRLTDDAERHSCRPSIDTLFESVARTYGAGAIGCLLTGMGRDGAEGLRVIRTSGGTTIAQDEASSVVFGMPREAINLGAAERILPVGDIGQAVATMLRKKDPG
jgi:two-component system, chemotaxis family, protein-glutamate methylesterase/glutaminase